MTTMHDDRPELESPGQPDPHTQEPARQVWYKTPSFAWIICTKTLTSLSLGITTGPYLEVFTDIVCREFYYERLGPNMQAAVTFSRCTEDPRVQAEVARANAVFAAVAGILAFFTAGWWGRLTDRRGRTRVLGMGAFASLLGDFLILFIYFYPNTISGGYWLLIITPIVQGILGLPSSDMAAETAYVRDTSGPRNLSGHLTLLFGIFHMSWTIGPIIGGFLNEKTGRVITALYAATFLHTIHACIVWFALPESIDKSSMADARNRYAQELASAANTGVSPFRQRLAQFTKVFWGSLPFQVLVPKRLPNSPWRRDWSLILLALSVLLIMSIKGSSADGYQYTLYTFGWSSLQLGYFISATGFSAAAFLMVVLPAIIRVMKRRRPLKLETAEDAKHDMVFDFRLLQVSSFVIAVGYALMALAPTGLIFTLCNVIASFGQGFIPVSQGVATALYANASDEKDTGRLLSAFGLVYGIGNRFFGPMIFGLVFSHTVSFFPTAIFWTSVGFALVAFALLAFIRLPKSVSVKDAEQQDDPVFRDDSSTNSELEPLLQR